MRKWMLIIALAIATASPTFASPRTVHGADVQLISTPDGCGGRLFCACGLAKYWGIWTRELNKVSNWAQHFHRAPGPAVGVAAVRNDNHHIMGIVGGGPGAWEVVDFNSGNHQSRRYVAASFPGYHFLAVHGGGFNLASGESQDRWVAR